jgi:DNA-binding XRE family transcriptional regulator
LVVRTAAAPAAGQRSVVQCALGLVDAAHLALRLHAEAAMSELVATIGRNIRQVRQSYRWSQFRFARFLGITRQTLYAYEKGHTCCPSDVLLKVNRFTGHTVDWFFEKDHDDLKFLSFHCSGDDH